MQTPPKKTSPASGFDQWKHSSDRIPNIADLRILLIPFMCYMCYWPLISVLLQPPPSQDSKVEVWGSCFGGLGSSLEPSLRFWPAQPYQSFVFWFCACFWPRSKGSNELSHKTSLSDKILRGVYSKLTVRRIVIIISFRLRNHEIVLNIRESVRTFR